LHEELVLARVDLYILVNIMKGLGQLSLILPGSSRTEPCS
jgi:hypothetical protein